LARFTPVCWNEDPPPGDISARVFASASISIAHDTVVPVPFDSEEWDTDSIHSVSANTSRLTASTPGKYLVFGHAVWDVNGTGVRRIGIQKNGADVLVSERGIPMAAETMPMAITTHCELAAGDFVELVVDQDSGGPLDIIVSGPSHSIHFGMVKLP
jgi:hypothetical protein